jgi:hypothetical protein
LNVGSGGGAAAAPTAGGAAAGGDVAEEKKEEEKEEGTKIRIPHLDYGNTNTLHSQGRVRRGYGLRSLRLDYLWIFHPCNSQCMATVTTVQYWAGRVASIDKQTQLKVSAKCWYLTMLCDMGEVVEAAFVRGKIIWLISNSIN